MPGECACRLPPAAPERRAAATPPLTIIYARPRLLTETRPRVGKLFKDTPTTRDALSIAPLARWIFPPCFSRHDDIAIFTGGRRRATLCRPPRPREKASDLRGAATRHLKRKDDAIIFLQSAQPRRAARSHYAIARLYDKAASRRQRGD